MHIPSIPKNEEERLTKLRELLILDTPPEEIFDNLAKLANNVCGTSVAFISLIDNDRQWFKSMIGLNGIVETPRDIAFCAHTITCSDVMEVCDASSDPRFCNNPLVTDHPNILFYAGAPIMLGEEVMGTLSVIDSKVKSLTSLQKKLLKDLAQYIACILTYRKDSLSQNKNITNLLSGIVQTSEDAIVSKTLDGIITSWNTGAENIFGYKSEEIIGRRITTLFPEERLDEEESLMRFIKHGQPILHYETIRVRKGGERIDVSVSLSPIRDSSGQVIGATKIAREITNRKKNEKRIQRLGNLYKGISTINQAIIRLGSEAELFPLICNCAVEYGEMNVAFVVQLSEDSKSFHIVAQYGCNTEDAAAISTTLSRDDLSSDGLIATAIRDNRPVIIQDYLADPMTLTWQDTAQRLNWQSSAAFPIQKNGSAFAVLVVCSNEAHVFNEEITFHLYEMARDVSFALNNFERESQRIATEESLKLAASVFESSIEGIKILDASNKVVAVNPAFTEITGYTQSEVVGKPPQFLSPNNHDREHHDLVWDQVNKTGFWQGEIWDQRKNGDTYPRWQTINTVFNEDKSVQKRIVMFTDNSAKRDAEHKIWMQANFDNLTNLPNRQMFYDRLEQELKKAAYSATPFALLLLDIDRFKEVNDSLGHDKGDELLKEIARRINACVRNFDTVARLGGDEFTIILSDLKDESIIQTISQDILDSLRSDLQFDDLILNTTASIGISVYPRDGASAETLLKKADQAMYASKDVGKNCYTFYTQSMQQSSLLRIQIASDLKNALAGNQFWVAYQPIVELSTGNIFKAEALIRWDHPSKNITPAEFIPVAENSGLINEIGEFVFNESVRQVKQWQQKFNPKFQISINKSPLQFRSSVHNSKAWNQTLIQHGVAGSSIAIEITEGLLLDSNPNVTKVLNDFRSAGMQVSIDDFGTGYSALSYLKKFEVDYLKIDKSFVDNICVAPADLALCEAIIVMSHKLNIKVIAEGVETPEQLQLLKEIGCDYGQGFLWSQPMPAAEFEALCQGTLIQQQSV